ncbi:MAG: preprotein translocase subunit SecY, partial [Spirochaetota bacterium]|nr:preprotein translocase subunit SecY [Spirochaetota bacterium]
MANIITNIFSVKELRDRIIFTLFILAVFRIGAQISVPGINSYVLSEIARTNQSGGLFDLLNLFSGGAMAQFSLFALGIMPYISASIIMQLLKVVVPSLDRLSKEGSYGQKKIELYTKYGTLVLCVIQAVGLYFLFETRYVQLAPKYLQFGELVPGNKVEFFSSFWFTFVLTLTTGTMFLLWLGERITERGIGNGVSLIIFAGIVARFPVSVYQLYGTNVEVSLIMMVVVVVIFLVLMGLVVGEQLATRKIPVQYAKRVVGNKMYGAQSTHIPFKINPSGVIPIIFASSVIIFPAQIMEFFSSAFKDNA